MRIDELGQESSFESIAAQYAGQSWLPWFVETEEQNDPATNGVVSVRLVQGDLRIDGDLETGDGPWALVVDGNLVLSGDLLCRTGDYLVSTLIVTGSVRARNVRFHTSARVGIEGALEVDNLIVGSSGDSGATLGAETITARVVILDSHTSIGAVDRNIRAVVVGAKGWTEFVPDVVDSDFDRHPSTFVPEVLNGGILDLRRAWSHRQNSILLPDAERTLRAAKGL